MSKVTEAPQTTWRDKLGKAQEYFTQAKAIIKDIKKSIKKHR